jgi:hypothetical protein
MKNCLILGSGRSGTSMVAGALSGAGYYMGPHLMPPTPSNPKGYYESNDIQDINEKILRPLVPGRPRFLPQRFFRNRVGLRQFWLARVPLGAEMHTSSSTDSQICELVKNEPYCFKDPRFSYTLPVWRRFVQNTVFVCVFRDPASTAASILKDCADRPYLWNLSMNFEWAVEVWTMMYRHILEIHRHRGSWMFMHFDQGLTAQGMGRLDAFVEAKLDRAFPDPQLKHRFPSRPVPAQAQSIYEQLCSLADYRSC